MTLDFSEAGCRNCGKGGDYSWKFYTDGKGNFSAEHKCGHRTSFKVTDKKDEIRVYPARFFG